MRTTVRHLLLLSLLLDESFVALMLTMSNYSEAAKSIEAMSVLQAAFPGMLCGMEPSMHLLAGGNSSLWHFFRPTLCLSPIVTAWHYAISQPPPEVFRVHVHGLSFGKPQVFSAGSIQWCCCGEKVILCGPYVCTVALMTSPPLQKLGAHGIGHYTAAVGAQEAAGQHYSAASSTCGASTSPRSTVQHLAVLSLAILQLDRDAPDAVAAATEILKQHGLYAAIDVALPHHERCALLANC